MAGDVHLVSVRGRRELEAGVEKASLGRRRHRGDRRSRAAISKVPPPALLQDPSSHGTKLALQCSRVFKIGLGVYRFFLGKIYSGRRKANVQIL